MQSTSPQSTSVSTLFWTPSLQCLSGGTTSHVRDAMSQWPDTQSASPAQPPPFVLARFFPQSAPSQSAPVSAPSSTLETAVFVC